MRISGRIAFWHKVLAALLVVGVVPIALVSAVSINATREHLTQLGVTNIQQRDTSTSAAIDAYLVNRLGDIVVVSALPDVVRFAQNPADPGLRVSARDALKSAAARSPEYESVAVVDQGGTIVAASIATDEGTSVKFREYFTVAMAAGTPFVSDPSYSVITNKPAIFFSAPVRSAGGQVLAVVRSRLNLAAVWSIVEGDVDSVGAGAHSFLVDDYGIRIAVSETKDRREQAESLIYTTIAPIDPETAKKLAADKRFGLKTPEQLIVDPLPTLRASLDGLGAGGRSTFAYGGDEAEQRGVVTRLKTKPWAYVLAVPLATYTRSADEATTQAVLTVLLGVILSMLIGIWLTTSLVLPLRRLTREASRVSTGDIDLDLARFDTRSGDDITREVASAFDRLLSALRFYAQNDEGEAAAGGDR
ncbi:MAG: cache domain-containing protein [Candidatus Limnocylindria bacterium]